ncbi:MAG: hypothetical protein ACMXYL_02655 [Candidatus Woesearchaeota archaeon]
MNNAENIIIRVFEEQKRSLTADDIMPILYPQEYFEITSIISDEHNSHDMIEDAKTKLYQLRRRVLYHIKQLENKGVIGLDRRSAKGKKHYAMITRNTIIVTSRNAGINNDMNEHYIIRENIEDWARKFSSLLIDCDHNDNRSLQKMLSYRRSISDAISLYNPNASIFTDDILETIRRASLNEGLSFTGIIPVKNYSIRAEEKAEYNKLMQKLTNNKITIILSLESNDLRRVESISLLEETARHCIESRIPLYVHNKDAKKAPVFVGRLGPYTMSEKDYDMIQKRQNYERKVFVIGLNNVLCDVESFLQENSVTELRKSLLLKGTDLFAASLNLRRRAPELLPENVFGSHCLDIARDYYRFWNYGLKDPHADQETVIGLLNSAKQTIAGYSHAQSTIYTSCGMPTPFRTAFSVLFEESLPPRFSKGQFKKLVVKDTKDIMDNSVKETLFLKQQAAEIFNGGDRTRITKKNGNSTHDIVSEISFVQKSYAIPLVCYDFSMHERELTLNDFIKG